MTDETKPAKIKMPEQNGVTRPNPDSMIGKLWEIADSISNQNGRPATRKEVVETYMAQVPGAVLATANTQYARWVTFHAVGDLLRAERKAATEARREAKKAEREQAKASKDAEKQAEREAKEAAKAEREAKAKAKEEAKASKDAERAAKKEAAEREKAEKKAAREAEKAAKAAAKNTEQDTANAA